ncbi:hypothetical protein SRHO_G00111290 [Serrasalmus rhombeus]
MNTNSLASLPARDLLMNVSSIYSVSVEKTWFARGPQRQRLFTRCTGLFPSSFVTSSSQAVQASRQARPPGRLPFLRGGDTADRGTCYKHEITKEHNCMRKEQKSER